MSSRSLITAIPRDVFNEVLGSVRDKNFQPLVVEVSYNYTKEYSSKISLNPSGEYLVYGAGGFKIGLFSSSSEVVDWIVDKVWLIDIDENDNNKEILVEIYFESDSGEIQLVHCQNGEIDMKDIRRVRKILATIISHLGKIRKPQ